MKILPSIYKYFRSIVAGLKHESGSTAIEYSVAAACFLALILGTLEVCSATYSYTVLADAANEGVHYAMLNSTDEAGTIDIVKSYAGATLHDTSDISVLVAYPDGNTTPPSRVSVSVSYQYVPYLSTIMSAPPTLHAFAEGRLVR